MFAPPSAGCSTIANREKVVAVRALAAGGHDHAVSTAYVSLHTRILFDESITPSTRALMLSEPEALGGAVPDLEHRYWDIAHARTAMLQVGKLHVCEVLRTVLLRKGVAKRFELCAGEGGAKYS